MFFFVQIPSTYKLYPSESKKTGNRKTVRCMTPLLCPFLLLSLLSVFQVRLPRRGGHCDRQGQLRHELSLLRYVHPGHPGTVIPHPIKANVPEVGSACSNTLMTQEGIA